MSDLAERVTTRLPAEVQAARSAVLRAAEDQLMPAIRAEAMATDGAVPSQDAALNLQPPMHRGGRGVAPSS